SRRLIFCVLPPACFDGDGNASGEDELARPSPTGPPRRSACAGGFAEGSDPSEGSEERCRDGSQDLLPAVRGPGRDTWPGGEADDAQWGRAGGRGSDPPGGTG